MTITSANPDDLDHFVTAAARRRRTLEQRLSELVGLSNAVVAASPDFAVQSNVLASGSTVMGVLEYDERFVDKVADTLRRADRDPSTGVASIASAQVAAALRAAGLAARPGPVEVEPGVLLGIPPTSGFVDDPICAANGNFVEVETDLGFPGRTAVLDVVRVHNSLASNVVGAFGPGWTSALDLRLDHVPGGVLRVHLADGAVVPFVARDDETVLRAVGRRELEVEAVVDGWVLREGPTKAWRFDGEGRFVGGTAGAAILEVERDGERIVAFAEHRSGRRVAFEWDGGRVVAASTDDGRVATYSYDGDAASLVAVDRPGGGRTYGVDGTRITSVADADGVVLARNVYDDDGKVLEQTNELGRTTLYLYTDNGTTVISDTAGGPRNAFTHDGRGNVTAVVDGTGRALRLVYDDQGRVIRITDRDGAVRRFAYDGAGRLVERIDPDGLAATWGWDDEGRLVREVARGGYVTTYEYAGAGRQPVRITTPGGGVIAIDVDALDQPVRVVDADGVATTFEWDADGQIVARTDALGHRTTFGYDRAGLLERVVDGAGVVTELRSDEHGRVVEADVAGATSRYSYTAAGRVLGGADQEGVSWTAAYGAHGRAVSFTDGVGSRVGFEWDALGNLVGVVAPDGERYEQDFDPAGRLLVARDPEGRETRSEVDAEGRVLGVVDAAGRTWRRDVDVLGRTTAIVAPDGARSTYAYHPNGIVARVTRPSGASVATELDEAGRIGVIVDELGGRFELAYTAAGRLHERRSPSGRVERWEYDAAGRTVASTVAGAEVRVELDGAGRTTRLIDGDRDLRWRYSPAGEVVGVEGTDGDVFLERDRAGRVTSITDADGVRTTYRWDERGLLAEATEAPGVATTFERDVRGRLAATTTPAGERTALAYDRTGYLRSLTDPMGTLARVLDPTGRVVAEQGADGHVIERTLDAVGRTTALGAAGAGASVTFAYDADGRLTEAVRVADDVRTAFGWDPAGRLREVQGPSGATSIERDADGEVRGWRVPAGVVRVRRDLSGRIVGLDDPEAGPVDAPAAPSRRRDRAGRIVGAEGGEVYRYDDAGRLVEALDGAGDRWSFTYDDRGLLAGEDSPLGRRRYHRGFLGRLERLEDLETDVVTTFAYDGAGRRIAATGSDGSATSWTWDELGHLRAIERAGSDGESVRIDVGVDAWGRPFRIGDVEVEWDDALSGLPARIGSTRYLHLAGRARATTTSDTTWSSPTPDPWGSTPGASAAPALGFHGQLSAWGLVWMGQRVYDTTTREFLSPDPLPPVAGRPGAASLYAYGFQDPVNHLDPTGRRPVSQAEFDAIREREERGRFGQAWHAITEDPWGTLAAVAVVAVGTALLFTPAAAIGAGILIGAAASATVGVATGTFSPRMVAIGGAVGAIPGGTSLKSAIAIGAGIGGAVEAGNQVIAGDFDLSNLLLNTVVGGASGGLAHGISVRIAGAHPTVEIPAPPTTPPSGARFVVDPAGVVTDLGPRARGFVVMGEDMPNRVIPMARSINAEWYDPPKFSNDAQSLAHNRYWIREQMNQGKTLVDIGPAYGRSEYPGPTSPWYKMELGEVAKRHYPYYERIDVP